MRTEVVDTKYGQMRIFSDDPGCSRLIKEYGEYSPGEVAFLSLWLDKNSVVVDVGANIGGLTLPFASQVSKVYAFEPQSHVRTLLEENTKDCKNVEVLPYGLSNTSSTWYCGPETSNWGKESTGSVQLQSEQFESCETVECRTLDSFNLAPNLIKIDVEGMELHVLAGALETIKKYKPYIWMERSFDTKSFGQICAYLNYSYCTIDLPMCYPFNYRNNQTSIYPNMAHLSVFVKPNA